MLQSLSQKDLPSEPWARSTSHLLTAAIDQTPNLIAIFDEVDRLIYSNVAFRRAFGFGEACDLKWRDIIENAFARRCGPVIEAKAIDDWLTRADTRRGTVPFRSFEVDFHDGRWFLVTETMQSDGSLLLVGTDITTIRADSRTLREERDKAVRAAWTDPLTGLANRRYCLDQIESWRANASDGAYGALAMIDLDHFKQVNDEHGHELGDRVLVDFARFVLERVRLQDLFGRIGGEEFLLFMPECPTTLAKTRLEALIAELENRQVVSDIPAFRYSFSSGLIRLTPEVALDEGLHAADQLLYLAKASGRACISCASKDR